MGIFGGRKVFGRFETEEERIFKELEQQSVRGNIPLPQNKRNNLPSLREQARIQAMQLKLEREQKRKQRFLDFQKRTDRGLSQVGERAGGFVRQGATGGEVFNQEQIALQQMFGGGEKIWGYGEPVRINNALTPSRNGDYETGRLFGF